MDIKQTAERSSNAADIHILDWLELDKMEKTRQSEAT
jgi:hypothetical protein